MAISQRERYITIVLMAAGALFAVDRLALQPYLDTRAELIEMHKARQRSIRQARDLLKRADQLQTVTTYLHQKAKGDVSEAENQVLHMLRTWEKEASLKSASFLRIQSADEHGFKRLTFRVSAVGTMQGVALMLYRAETTEIPLRIDEFHVLPRNEAGNELQLEFNVSTLALGSGGVERGKGRPRPIAMVATAEDRR